MRSVFDMPLFGAEAEAERARIFKALVGGTAVVATIVVTTVILLRPRLLGLGVFSLVSVNAVGLASLLLSRRGLARTASWVLLLGLMVPITHNAWLAGGILSPGLALLLVFPLMAGMLLGDTAGLIITGVSSLVVAAMVAAQMTGTLPRPGDLYGPQPRLLLFALYLAVVVVLTRLMTGSVAKLVARLRTELLERERVLHDLGERMKELRLLHAAARLLNPARAFDRSVLTELVELMPAAWLNPDRCEARISYGDVEVHTPGWRETPWRQSSPFRTREQAGVVEVAYREEQAAQAEGPFLAEERALLDSLAELLGSYLDQDILERERRNLEMVLRAVLDSTDDLIFAVDAKEFRVIACNEALSEYFAGGKGIAQVMGMTPLDLFGDTSYVGVWTGFFERALREGPYMVEQYRASARGLTLEVHFGLLRRDNAVFGISVFGRNIAARIAAEAEIRASERRFHAIFDASPIGVGLSRAGIVLVVNPAFARMFGYAEPDELVGLSVIDCVASESREIVLARLRKRMADEPVESEYEMAGLRKDGTPFPVHARIGMLQLPDGPALLSFFEDLTERRKAEDDRTLAEAQLRHAQQMEAIGTLAAGFAHDFNNILAPIIGGAELALQEIATDSGAREDVLAIEAAGLRARDLVRQILMLSRSEDETEPVPVDLLRVVRETVRLLRAGLPSTIRIRTEVPRSCPPVLGTATRLHQVLLNLCTNARDAMAGAGTLTIGVREIAPDAESTHNGDARQHWILVSVSDTGAGMSPEVQRRIFEPYYTTKPRGKGTGLGLSVTHGIVSGMGGRIRVSSVPGEGTRFEVMLPASARSDAVPVPETLIPRGHGERVLVIDDEAAVRGVTLRILRSLGYLPAELEDPAGVLPLLESPDQSVDAMIIDQTMPGSTGIQLAANCLAIRPNLPIVLCSGDAEITAAGHIGIRTVLAKPFTIQAMAEALHAALAHTNGPARPS